MTEPTLEDLSSISIDLGLTSDRLGEYFQDPNSETGEKSLSIAQEINEFYKIFFKEQNIQDYLPNGDLLKIISPIGFKVLKPLAEKRILKIINKENDNNLNPEETIRKFKEMPKEKRYYLASQYLQEKMANLEKAKQDIDSLSKEEKNSLSNFFYKISDLSDKISEGYSNK